MAIQYAVGSSIIDNKPQWMLVVPDEIKDYQIISDNDELSDQYRQIIEELHQQYNIPLSKDTIVEAMRSSYESVSEWIDSPDDLDATVRKLTDVYKNENAVSLERAAGSRKIADSYREAVQAEWLGDEGGESDLPISAAENQKYLERAGLAERYAQPGMGYAVPENWEEIFNGLVGGGEGAAEEVEEEAPLEEES